jgi:hypothetical protein
MSRRPARRLLAAFSVALAVSACAGPATAPDAADAAHPDLGTAPTKSDSALRSGYQNPIG